MYNDVNQEGNVGNEKYDMLYEEKAAALTLSLMSQKSEIHEKRLYYDL